jgi:WD40 repeat protein/DNA-binding SARP family transcriptional activator
MEFLLLGPLEVRRDGVILPLGGPKQRAVLAHLLLRANAVVSADRLITGVWGENPPRTARNTLQTYVRHLRKTLGPARLQHRAHGYQIAADPGEVDVHRFTALVDRARGLCGLDPAAASDTLREALAQWRGPALDDLTDQPSLGPEISRLEATRMAVLEERFDIELQLGQHAALIPELHTLVEEFPLREALLAHLMIALYRGQRQADALAAYGRGARRLREELGIDPSPALQELHQRILRQDPGLETVRPVAAGEARNPYRGLRPFQEPDAADFFGRERYVARLLARLSDPDSARFLAVVGPSGSGKSSAVAAGLVPALRRDAIPGSGGWLVVQIHPGAHPLDEIAAALAPLAADPHLPLRDLLEHDDGLVRAAHALLPADGGDLLIVIDQFEELFTLTVDDAVRAWLLTALTVAATDPRSRVRVVLTMRADYYDRPLSYRDFGELLAAHTEALTPLGAQELIEAITSPAAAVGVRTDPPLLAEIVAEVVDQPAALPLLQYALTELFDQREGDSLTLNAYRAIGGLSGALAKRAEEIYARSGQSGRYAIQQLFLRLITLGEEGGGDTRRRVPRSELASLEAEHGAVEAAIDAFGARRLLTFDRDPVTRAPTVEVAHEALLREWGRLRGWIEQGRDTVRAHRRLGEATREWSAADGDPSFLLRGDRLARFEGVVVSSGVALTHDERTFIDASLAHRDIETSAESARLAREANLERRLVVRLRALVAVFATLTVVAAGLTAFVVLQRLQTEREARLATSRELAAAAVASLDADPERSILLAMVAVDTTRVPDGVVTREAEEALHRALQRSRVVLAVPQGGGGLAISADGTRFATASRTGVAAVWTVASGSRDLELRGHAGAISDVAYAPDGSRLATVGSDATVRLWDARTGGQLRVLRGHSGAVWSAVFSPDGRQLATTGEDGTLRLWDVATGTQTRLLGGADQQDFGYLIPSRPAFSPDGARLASPRGNGTVTVYDLRSGQTVATISGNAWAVADVAFSPDGRRIATASGDGARIWDAVSGTPLTTLSGQTGDLEAVAFSPDGARVATAGADATARVFDAASGRQLLALAGHTAEIGEVAFHPAGDRLFTASADGTTRIWDISVAGGRDWLTATGPAQRYGSVAFSPDGATFAVPTDPDGVVVRDSATGATRRRLTGYDTTIGMLAFSPDGGRLAGAAGTGATRRAANLSVPIWDTATGALVMTLTGHRDEVSAVAFSPDGTRIVTGSWDGTLRLWDAATGAQLRVIDVGGDAYALTFSADGRYVLTGVGTDGTLTAWDAATLTAAFELHGHTGYIQSIAVGGDGHVVSASGDGTARIWDLASRTQLRTLSGHNGAVFAVAVSPDGATIATSGADGMIRLWDAASGLEVLSLFGHDQNVYAVAFSPDRRLLASASTDGTVALHLLPIHEVMALAGSRVTRTLTGPECRQYLHRDSCSAAA